MNEVMLIGRLGGDPVMKRLPDGKVVTNFSLATSQKYTNKEGTRVEQVQWHRIACWGSLGERAQKYLSKGRHLFLKGRIEYNEYKDKEGNRRWSTNIIANSLTFLDPKKATTAVTETAEVMEVPEEVLNPQLSEDGTPF